MLYFTKYAAAKYFFTRDFCNTQNLSGGKPDFIECSSIGISQKDNINVVEDLYIPEQVCTTANTEISNKDLTMFRFEQEDKGYPISHSNVWLHTHPGASAGPSSNDMNTWKTQYLEVKEKPFGAMGIIAQSKGKDCVTCKMIYDSIIGRQSKQCNMYLEAYPDTWLPFEYVYEIEELHSDMKVNNDIHYTFFGEFEEHHEKWLEEIKAKVTEKVYKATTGSYNHGGVNNIGFGTANGYANAYDNSDMNQAYHHSYQAAQNEKKKETEKKKQTQNQVGQTGTGRKIGTGNIFSPDKLLKILIANKKDSFNQFNRTEQHTLLNKYKTNQAAIEEAQKAIKKNEKAYHVFDLDVLDNDPTCPDLIDNVTGDSRWDKLTEDFIQDICLDANIRPSHFKMLVEQKSADFKQDLELSKDITKGTISGH